MIGAPAGRSAVPCAARPARRGSRHQHRLLVLGATLALLAVILWARTLQVAPAARRCAGPWAKLQEGGARPRVAIVALSDVGRNVSKELWDPKGRSFEGVLEATRENKEGYARRHGYRYFDASFLLDTSRPPSWSKILAVQYYLAEYDWVFWMDSDSVVTNPDIKLESILPAGERLDFIVTKDPAGYNAGMWFIRNSPWSHKFLRTWWGMSSFVRKAGDTKSGDNDALKHILANMDETELEEHVGVAPQCTFNSYVFKSSVRNWIRHAMDPEEFECGLHQQGDFIVHLAGMQDKLVHIRKFLNERPTGSKAP
ncbi:unnamed protein product [Ostreobium quekettii]|uniref:Galactosyl transferase n=1 Tax=Ostreobium quekettii TaxID=121088 RepID=A0A8S1ITX7_9CHLO|nr:unnamed protein product [Ostreobium quekettii]|eukprot:evm.model.scf_876.10 EVM.evm.TU.scf_876.10   scf_876:53153-54619(-)